MLKVKFYVATQFQKKSKFLKSNFIHKHYKGLRLPFEIYEGQLLRETNKIFIFSTLNTWKCLFLYIVEKDTNNYNNIYYRYLAVTDNFVNHIEKIMTLILYSVIDKVDVDHKISLKMFVLLM